MGEKNKLLLPYNDSTIVEETIKNIIELNDVFEIIVVCGYQNDMIAKKLMQYPVKTVYNKNYATGLTSSIKCGLAEISKKSNAVMIALADMVKFKATDYQKLIAAYTSKVDNKCIVRPISNKIYRNPVIFSNHFFEDIANHESPNGCSKLISDNSQYVRDVPYPNENLFFDIDTPQDYQIVNEALRIK